jgi:serine/threonine-protein kinase
VRHPNVVEVFELGVLGEHPYIVTELVEGCSLDDFRRAYAAAERRMPLDLVLFVATEAAEGLAAARCARNAEGIVLQMSHHDLSMRQILLSWNGEVKVGDFGFRSAGMSSSGIRPVRQAVRKTLTYLAPEIVRGDRGDARSDVFAMGVMLHELLRGPRYAEDATDIDVYESTLRGDILRTVREPLLAPELSALIERATSPDPQERHAHAGVLAYDLRRIAFAMGVGDARSFLRNAMYEMTEGMLPNESTEPNADDV